jgi:hypothetical protein
MWRVDRYFTFKPWVDMDLTIKNEFKQQHMVNLPSTIATIGVNQQDRDNNIYILYTNQLKWELS